MYELTGEFAETLAHVEGVKPEYVLPFAGSSAPLHQAVLAFCSPKKSFIAANPGYEAGSKAADFIGAKTIGVPLTKDYAHDVKAMAQADPNAGLLYLCNPNNPTGTLTSREDIEWLLANKPAGSILMVDEAYIHIGRRRHAVDGSGGQGQGNRRAAHVLEDCMGWRACARARQFARPDLLQKIMPYSAGALPMTAMVGATASLKVKTLVPERRKIIRRHPSGHAEFPGQAQLPLRAIGVEQVHGGREAAGGRSDYRASQGERLCRAHLADLADLHARVGGVARRHEEVPGCVS